MIKHWEYKKMINRIVNSFLRVYPGLYNWAEDLKQEAMIAVVEAQRSYDPDRAGIAASTYVYRGIQLKLINYITREIFREDLVKGLDGEPLKAISLESLSSQGNEGEKLHWEDIVSGDALVDIPESLSKLELTEDEQRYLDGLLDPRYTDEKNIPGFKNHNKRKEVRAGLKEKIESL